jgi:flagellar basal body rod protein FlgG
MLPGFYSAATGMDVSARRHEATAQNLAYMHQAGYRRAVVVQETFESQFNVVRQNPLGNESLGVGELKTETDFSPGTLHSTGRSLDFALQGEGFFVVEGPAGPLYTRNGVFQIGENGSLVTVDGLAVKGSGGPLTVPPGVSSEEVELGVDGTLTAAGTILGKFDIVRFDEPAQLQRAGISLFEAPDDLRAEPADANVVQGMRENSNVQAVHELIALISGSRHYEAAQRAMQTLGKSIERHINAPGGN